MKSILGEVFYRERRMLPPPAELTVTLEDVSRADAPSTLVATFTKPLEGKAPPYSFAVEYDPSEIQPKRRYSLRSKITMKDRDGKDQLLMTSTKALDPFHRQPGEEETAIEIQLSMVGRSGRVHTPPKQHNVPAAGNPDTGLMVVSHKPLAELRNTYWKLLRIGAQTIVMGDDQAREAYFQLTDINDTIKGFAGCHQITGRYTKMGDNDLKFLDVGINAEEGVNAQEGISMETETKFLEVLQKTAYFSIHKETMSLLNAEKKKTAEFQAQHF